MKGKKIMALVLVLAMSFATINCCPTYAYTNTAAKSNDLSGLTVKEAQRETNNLKAITVAKRTPQEIMEYIRMHPDTYDGENIYKKKPNLNAPYSLGELYPEVIESVINSVNQMRFIAGLEGEVTENPEYSKKIQAGALINAVNNDLSHSPKRPAGMSDELYKLGSIGAGLSNISSGRHLKGAVHGQMKDSDTSNINRVGHRRWILYPQLDKVGFGQVERYSGLYVIGSTNYAHNEIGVAWPAQTMPIEYFSKDTAWSISFDSSVSSNAQVTLKRNKTKEVWNFTELTRTPSYHEDQFFISNAGYGQKGCIIFRPGSLDDITSGEVFDVTIKNLGIEGLENECTYQVEFFSLKDRYITATAEKTDIYLGSNGIQLDIDDSASWDNPTYTYSSSDSSIAEVTNYGLVIGKSVGTVTITIQAVETEKHNAGSVDITFNVYDLPRQEVVFDEAMDIDKIYGEESFTNKAMNKTTNGGEITYTSSDENVAKVNAQTGEVIIVGAGTADIIATAIEVTDTYGETSVSYKLNVAPKRISVENVGVSTKKYDGTNVVTSATIEFAGVLEGDILVEDIDFTVNASYEDENVGENKRVNVNVEILNNNYKLSTSRFVRTASITTSSIYALGLTNLNQEEGSVSNVGWTIDPKDKTARVEVEYGTTSGSAIVWTKELPTETGEYPVRARLVESYNLIPSGMEEDVQGTLVIEEKTVVPYTPEQSSDTDENEEVDIPAFKDIKGHWAEEYIKKATQIGIFKGKSATIFGPNDNMTREQMWMVISRLKGEGQTTMEDARAWAMNNDISDGTNPRTDVTREQLVTLIWRALGQAKSNYELRHYSDYSRVSPWAKEAFAWAVETGLVNGTTSTTLSPNGTATRAQLAAMLARLVYKMK